VVAAAEDKEDFAVATHAVEQEDVSDVVGLMFQFMYLHQHQHQFITNLLQS
jgi:hypothetical protein